MKQIDFTGNPTEEEVAACMAAIYLLRCQEEIQSEERETSPPASAWGLASRAEQTRSRISIRQSRATKNQTLWGITARSTQNLLTLALLVTSLFPLAVKAQEVNSQLPGARRAVAVGNTFAASGAYSTSQLPTTGKLSANGLYAGRPAASTEQQPAAVGEFTGQTSPVSNSQFAGQSTPWRTQNTPSCRVAGNGRSPVDGQPAANAIPTNSRRGFVPSLPVNHLITEAEIPQCKQPIRVAVAVGVSSVDLTLPDGAEVFDAETEELVAQLPSRSSWNISLRATSTTPKLCFSGKFANRAFKKVIVDRSVSPVKLGAYQYRQAGFQPVVLDSESPLFALGLRPLKSAPATYQPVGYFPPTTAGKTSVAPTVAPLKSYIIRPSRPDGIIGVGNRAYRGQMMIRPKADQLSVINTLDLEEYLLAVVPSEMPASWPLEALKAQSIAARSYAVANLGKHGSEGYDVSATVDDQVYNGIQGETENSNTAVAQTKGLVIKHRGNTVSAFFHSAGGGCTELAEHVWGKPVPYLKSVMDYDDRSPHFEWTRQFPVLAAEECLKKAGKDVGSLLAIMPIVKTSSGRVKTAMVVGTQGPAVLSGEELRRVFALPSCLFNACIDSNGSYVFAGRGHGHGLGMSQWGARTLAEQGYNAAQIVAYYYKDVAIESATFQSARASQEAQPIPFPGDRQFDQ